MHVCPKCKEGTVTPIRFKKSGQPAFLCELCQSLWLDTERINEQPTHTLQTYITANKEEYMVLQDEEKKNNHIAVYPFR